MSNTKYINAVEPPYFGRLGTFSQFAIEHGWKKPRYAPRSVEEYISYKYWCICNGYDAVAGAVQPEEKAYELARDYFIEEQQRTFKELLDEN